MPLFALILVCLIKSFGFLLVSFTFIGNKRNQVSSTKKYKRGSKEEKQASCDGQSGQHDSRKAAAGMTACQ